MNRYNSFYLIHKGLRAMLYDAALTLQRTDFTNSAEAQAVLEKVNEVLFMFDHHAQHEDSFVNPAVGVYEPALEASFEAEHVEDRRLGNLMKNLLNIYESTSFSEKKKVCGSVITKGFIEFMVFNLNHMAKEEMQLNQALWKHYTDEQIIALERQLLATIPPAEMQIASKWMMRAISNSDAVNWLKKVKHSAPQFVFNNLMNIAQAELDENRFEVIAEKMQEETEAVA